MRSRRKRIEVDFLCDRLCVKININDSVINSLHIDYDLVGSLADQLKDWKVKAEAAVNQQAENLKAVINA